VAKGSGCTIKAYSKGMVSGICKAKTPALKKVSEAKVNGGFKGNRGMYKPS
jgi:hypothetical protein